MVMALLRAFTIKDGHCDLKLQYVMTQRLKAERKPLGGCLVITAMRFTDDESVRTSIVPWPTPTLSLTTGMILAMKEDQPPYAMDPFTLETKGLFTWDGQMTATSFTAHPKIDYRNRRPLRLCLRGERRGHRRHRHLQLRQARQEDLEVDQVTIPRHDPRVRHQ